MTAQHVRAIERLAPADGRARIGLLMEYAPGQHAVDVPDPWYGGPQDFVKAFDMIEAGVDGLLRSWALARD
jgi:protein-tyrosine phosphatase